MIRSFVLVLAVILGMGAKAHAAERELVVVELYTSQGCSSCPPADRYLQELAARPDVLALGLHVDYWDYIGWKDIFGSPAFTARQRAYGRSLAARPYTPQVIVNGTHHAIGHHEHDVETLMRLHRARGDEVQIALERKGTKAAMRLDAQPGAVKRDVSVLLVRYVPQETTQILRGENAGEHVTYANIVTEMVELGRWDMRAPLELSFRVRGSEKAAVIIQARGPGEILGAARIKQD